MKDEKSFPAPPAPSNTPFHLSSFSPSLVTHRFLKRRGPTTPPLTLRYRQIFILPTAFGWMLGLLMSAMLIGSLNFNNNLGLLTTFIVAGLAVLSMFLAYRNQVGLRVLRVSSRPVFAGQPLRLRVELLDHEQRARQGVRVSHGHSQTCVNVAAGHPATAVIDLPTRRRGWLECGRIRIANRVPLGLFEAWSWIYPDRPGLVYPRPASPVPALPRRGGQASQPDRQYEGEEFHSLRPWRSGDPLHRIAWKASQRHGELLSRQFQAESGHDIRLRLCDAPGRDIEEKLSILTAWVLAARRQGLHYALELPGEAIETGDDRRHHERCLKALALYGMEV